MHVCSLFVHKQTDNWFPEKATKHIGSTFSPVQAGLNTIELDDGCNAMFAGCFAVDSVHLHELHKAGIFRPHSDALCKHLLPSAV